MKLLALAVLASGSLYAGDKCPIVDPVCAVPFTGSVSVGYETDYIFRGLTFGEHAPWASAAINFALTDQVSVDLGTWYLNSTSGPVGFDELDVYSFLNFPLWVFKASLGGTWFSYPEGAADDNGEASLNLAYDVGSLVTLAGFAAYDFVGDGWYFQLGASKTIALADCLDLGLGGGVGYVDSYFGNQGWNHAYVRASLIYKLTETTSLTGYIGGNFPLEAIETVEEDKVHGGVSLTVTF